MTPPLKTLIKTKLQAIRIAEHLGLSKGAFSAKLNGREQSNGKGKQGFNKQQMEGIYEYLRELRNEIDHILKDKEE